MRVALIGLGRISNRHINSILNHDHLELVGVCDVDKQKFSQNELIENIPFYDDYLELVLETKPEIVSVLTDSGSHFEIGMKLAELGVNSIIEKPLTLTVSQADRMIDKYKLAEKKLFIVKQNRFNYPLQKFKQALDNGEIGKPFLCNVTVHWCRSDEYYNQDEWRGKWISDGGVISNQAIHHLDAMIWLMGPVTSVSSFNSTFGSDIEVDDTNISIVKFASGALGTIEATTATRPENKEGSITVLGSKGTIKVGGHAMNKIDYWRTEAANHTATSELNTPRDLNDVYGDGHSKFYNNIYESLVNNSACDFFGKTGRDSLELVASLYLSNHLGRIVEVGEDTSCIRLGAG